MLNLETFIQSQPQDKREAIAKEILRGAYNHDLFLTVTKLCGYVDVCRPTHDSIIQALESDTRKKLILEPRGTFKSSIGTISYPIWLLNRDPNIRILIQSEVYTNSKNFLREIRLHLERDRLTSIYGVYKSSTWNEGEIIISQRTANLKEATITAGGIDAVKTGQHYDVIICDDLNSENNSRTVEGCQRVVDHFKMLTSILEPTGTLVVIATRYSDNDVPGFVIDSEIFPKAEVETELF